MYYNGQQTNPWLGLTGTQGFNTNQFSLPNGGPTRPGFDSLLGNNGLIGSPYRSTDQFDRSAQNQLRSEALRSPGEASVWRGLIGEQFDNDVNQQLSNSRANSHAQTSQGLNQLAQRGGYTTGSGERLLENSNRNALLNSQGIRNNAFNQRLGLDIQDDTRRRQDLQSLNQSLFADAAYKGGIQDQNINRSLAENQQLRQDRLSSFGQQAQAFSTDRLADETARAARQQSQGLFSRLFG